MALREYVCAEGHVTEKRVRIHDAPPRAWACDCGLPAGLKEISRPAHAQKRTRWGSDFQWESELLKTHNDIQEMKAEARATMAEAKANGWVEGSRRKSF